MLAAKHRGMEGEGRMHVLIIDKLLRLSLKSVADPCCCHMQQRPTDAPAVIVCDGHSAIDAIDIPAGVRPA